MAKAEVKKTETKQPETTPDVKVNTVAEAAARIARGEKVRHPGPWKEVKLRDGMTFEQTVAAMSKEGLIVGFNPKTKKVLLKADVKK